MPVPTLSLRLRTAALACIVSATVAVGTTDAAVPSVRVPQSVVSMSAVVPAHLAVRHPAGSYLPNTVIIKTRSKVALSPDAKGFMATALNTGLLPYNVRSVRAPFAEFSEALAAKDVAGVSRVYEVTYNTAVDPYDVCLALSSNPDVEYAEPVYRREVAYKPNDPQLSQQYALQKVQAEQAWDVTKGNKDVLIAIVDTGVDFEHEDLADNLWTNPNEIAGNGKDDDSNGKVDDVRGWDFVGNATLQQVFSGQFQEDNDPKVRVENLQAYDVRSHGTTVAGAAAAVTNNAKGIAGMGFNCRYVPVKCGSDNASAQGIYRGYEAILYAARLGADVINCSWGGIGSSMAELDVITQATALGSLVIAASGNDGIFTDVNPIIHYPSGYANVLSVGATQSADAATDFTNYGGRTLVYAPGDNVRTTVPGNQYAPTSGTSIASPIVAGIAALVKSVHPDWTPRQILQQIRSTCDNAITGTTSTNRFMYYGRVNAYRAVQYNQSFTSGQRIPGISSTAIDVLPESAESSIKTLDPTPVKITLKNYLAAAPNVQVSVRSLDGLATFPTSTFSIGTLAALGEQSFTLTLQLVPYTSWSSGNVDILLTYKSGEYEDYERLSIPVALPANDNSSSTLAFPLYPYDVQWQSASSPLPNVLWAVGLQPDGGYFYSTSVGSPVRFSQKPAFAVAGISSSTAYAVVSNIAGGNAEVLKTTNSGQNWSSKSLTSLVNFANGIYFFDSNNGIILGDPLSSRWGVVRTTDAGTTWTQVNSIPTPTSGESGLVGSTGRAGDKVWFGTNKGRVIYSDNKGQNWNNGVVASGSVVLAVSFGAPERGVALYRTGSDTTLPILVASTADGGKTWTNNAFSFGTINFQPIGLYSVTSASVTVAVGRNSDMLFTTDNGRTWLPYRTSFRGVTDQLAGIVSGSKLRVWTIGAGTGYTESTLPRERVLTVNASSLAFGNVVVGSTATRTASFTNTGTKSLQISAIQISGGTAEAGVYTLADAPQLPLTVGAGQTLALDVVFAPVTNGYRTSTLRITSDADPSTVTVALSGLAQSATSVADGGTPLHVQHYPQPAAERLVVVLDMPASGDVRAEVVNAAGIVVWSGTSVQPAGTAVLELPVDNVASGVYFYRLYLPDGRALVRSFVVQR